MHDFYDRLENRTPAARESALFRDLNHVISVSKSRAPALRAQLKGVDLSRLKTRDDLARIPIRRRDDLVASQDELVPFGGYVATRLPALAQIFAGPSALLSVCGHARDWWGMARALYAAGLRKGTVVLNAMSYDLVPYGHMVDAGARAIGCPLIPAGNAAPSDIVAASRRLHPRFFCGAPERYKEILDREDEVGLKTTSLRDALLIGPLKHGLRSEFQLRKLRVRQALALPELGVIAYESGATDGLTLAEGYLLEIVDPVNGRPVADGREGELVLSRINLDYPLLRFGTGLISSILNQSSTCGRTNIRIRLPQPACDDALRPLHIERMREHHPGLNMRLSRGPSGGAYHLRVEHRSQEPLLMERLRDTLRLVTRQQGTVEIVAPGSLQDDAAPSSDEPTND